jgi:hypothetical protein
MFCDAAVAESRIMWQQRPVKSDALTLHAPGSDVVFALPGHPDGLEPLDKGGFPGEGGIRRLSVTAHTCMPPILPASTQRP